MKNFLIIFAILLLNIGHAEKPTFSVEDDFFIVWQFQRLDFVDNTFAPAKIVSCGKSQGDALTNAAKKLEKNFGGSVKNSKGEIIKFDAEKQLMSLLKDETWVTSSYQQSFDMGGAPDHGFTKEDLAKAESCKTFLKKAI